MAMGKKPGGTKSRGRSKITGNDTAIGNKAAVKLEKRTETNRPVKAGGGKNRGDRRDMSKPYTNNTKTRANHANPKGRGGQRRSG